MPKFAGLAGVQIEEPFAVLALDAYCGVCEKSVQDLMSERRGVLFLAPMCCKALHVSS